jgi:hypothetical protein
MIIIPPEDFEEVQSMLRMIRDTRTTLITTMAGASREELIATICASIISLHMVVEQILVNAQANQE